MDDLTIEIEQDEIIHIDIDKVEIVQNQIDDDLPDLITLYELAKI